MRGIKNSSTDIKTDGNDIVDKHLIAYAEDRAARFPTGHPTMIRALELINK